MPIRTNRGRAAVYRTVWGWPMRSPRHLVTAVVVLLVVVGLAGWMLSGPSGSSAIPTGSASTTRTTTTSPAGTSTREVPAPASRSPGPSPSGLAPRTPAPTPTPQTAAPEAIEVAQAWAQAWVNHPAGISSEDWTAQFAPFTTEEFLPQFQTVNPVNVPSTAVTGPVAVRNAAAAAVEASVPTDGGTLLLTIIDTPAGWRVSAMTKGEAP